MTCQSSCYFLLNLYVFTDKNEIKLFVLKKTCHLFFEVLYLKYFIFLSIYIKKIPFFFLTEEIVKWLFQITKGQNMLKNSQRYL